MEDIQSSNINSLWLQNIYDNLKKIEEFERYAREGCASIMDYLQIPYQQRNMIIADIQYKNLKLILNEMLLVIPDLSPVIGDEKAGELQEKFNKIRSFIKNRSLMIQENYSESKKAIINSQTTEQFDIALDALALLRQEIINNIKEILFIKSNQPTW